MSCHVCHVTCRVMLHSMTCYMPYDISCMYVHDIYDTYTYTCLKKKIVQKDFLLLHWYVMVVMSHDMHPSNNMSCIYVTYHMSCIYVISHDMAHFVTLTLLIFLTIHQLNLKWYLMSRVMSCHVMYLCYISCHVISGIMSHFVTLTLLIYSSN